MGIVMIDPLGDVSFHHLWLHGQELCDCPAKGELRMLHGDSCNWSKEWAALTAKRFDSPGIMYQDFVYAKNSIEHHIYTCAQCGAKRRVEDMVVIYEAPLSQTPPYNTADYKYPHNIVKVVCVTHNRKGRVGYQKVAPNGY